MLIISYKMKSFTQKVIIVHYLVQLHIIYTVIIVQATNIDLNNLSNISRTLFQRESEEKEEGKCVYICGGKVWT